jgi:hypothetical protein
MKNLKSYNDFVNESKIFQNLKQKLANLFDNVFNFFKKRFGKGAWLYYALALQEKGKLNYVMGKGKERTNLRISIEAFGLKPDQRSELEKAIHEMPSFKEEVEDIAKRKEEENDQVQTQVQAQAEQELEEMVEEKYKILAYQMIKEAEESEIADDTVPLQHADLDVRNFDAEKIRKKIISNFEMRASSQKFFDMKKPELQTIWLWGAPGIGKTDIIREACEELRCNLEVWHLSTIEPTDFVGLPAIEKGRKVNRLPRIYPDDNGPNDEGGIFFFDEMNRANPLVLAAALQLTLDGELGKDYHLPSKWIVVAAGNRPEDVPTVTRLEPALANRLAHCNLVTTLDDWQKWAMTKGKKKIDPDLLGFLTFQKEWFHHLPSQESKAEVYAWPSPRSWTKASMSYLWEKRDKKSGQQLSREEIMDIFAPLVGNAAAEQFSNFLELKKTIKPEDLKYVYSDYKKAPKPVEGDLGKMRAMAVAIAWYKRDNELTADEIENLFKYVLQYEEMEIAATILGLVKRIHPKARDTKAWLEGAEEFYNKYSKDLDIPD